MAEQPPPDKSAGSRIDLGTAFRAALTAALLAAVVTLLPVTSLSAFALGFGLALLAVVILVRRRLHEAHCDAALLEEEVARLALHAADLEARLKRREAEPEAPADFVLRRDRNGCVTFANKRVAEILGAEPEALSGQRIAPPVADRASPSGFSRSFEQEIETVAGPRRIIWTEAPVFDAAGRFVEIESVGRDVTAGKTERAFADTQATNATKSRFLAAVSHEMRTPLNGVLGMAGLLLDTPLTPEQKTYATAIANSGETLLGMVDDILDFAKIEAGKLTLEHAPFSPAALVTEIAELLGPRAQAKGLDLQAYAAPDVPRVLGDAMRLGQVLLNLVGNGIKFTERGGVALLVTAHHTGAVTQLTFTVRDTGIGVTAEDRTRIFGEFEQGQAGRASGQGTGLGLAIASRLVGLMGGRISLESAPGRGSVFSFTLALPVTEPAAGHAPALAGRRVVIATPSVILAPILARMLADAGAAVERAQGLEDAARLAGDTVLVDLAFGLEAVEAFARAMAGRARLIVLLPPAARPHLERLKAAGFATYLVKPVRPASLESRVLGVAEHAPEPEDPHAPLPQAPPLRILLAEDNDVNALLAMKLLESLGHRVRRAINGHAAVEAVRMAAQAGAPYDLVLLDVNMPGLDGYAAARAIRALPPVAGAHPGEVPILALTANAFAEDRAASRAAGLDGHLVKPLSRRALAEALAVHAPRGEPCRAHA